MRRVLLAVFVAVLVAATSEPEVLDEDLDVRMSSLEAEIAELRFLLTSAAADVPFVESPAVEEDVPAPASVTTVSMPVKEFHELSHGRKLAAMNGNGSAPGLTFLHPNAQFKFASGSFLTDNAGTLTAQSGLILSQSANVTGGATAYGRNLNLGLPFTAGANINANQLVSLASTGVALPGYGMQLSSSLTSLPSISKPIVLNMTGTAVVILYNDTNNYGQAIYWDTTTASPSSPFALSGTDVLWDLTATKVTATLFVACFRRLAYSPGRCIVGNINPSLGSISFTLPLDVYGSSNYINGVVTNLYDATDRVVLAFAISNVESSVLAVIAVSVSGLTMLSSGTLTPYQFSAMSDNLAAVALSRTNILLAYRLPRDQQGYICRLYFNTGDNIGIYVSSIVAVASPAAPLINLQLARLNATMAVLLYRNPNNNLQMYLSLIDASSATPVVLTPVQVGAGSQLSFGLYTTLAVVQPDRLSIVYNDPNAQPWVTDIGVSSGPFVIGRSQMVFRGTSNNASFCAMAAMTGSSIIVVCQQNYTSTVRGASAYAGTFYGAPLLLGFAKTSAVAGGTVTVTTSGAQDGFSNLKPGALTYARYDGGYDVLVNEAGGVSSLVVGRALASDTMLSLLNMDNIQQSTDVAALSVSLSGVTSTIKNLLTRLTVVETNLRGTTYLNPTVPVYYWAMWSTYSQWGGQWYSNNDQTFYLGVAPSNWGDNNGVLGSATSDKEVWRGLFNRKTYGAKNSVVWCEEVYLYSSTNSREAAALFRVNNPTAAAITWTVYFYYSCYGGWSNTASVNFNGAATWSTTGTCAFCTQGLSFSIPPGRTSTIMFGASTGGQSGTSSLYLAFYANSLILPTGLTYVDDLQTAQGGFES